RKRLQIKDRNPRTRPWRVLIQEFFERGWLNCLDADRYDIDDMIDLFSGIEEGLGFNPYAMGQPHPGLNSRGLWIYTTPPLARLPKVFVLYEVIPGAMSVKLWAVRFP
ncbi:hypothetical protein AB4144_32275, partial [Rhizobiaceae sp. 2RAB30]